jgi:general L-amino acid transport system substrate-binding protein
MRRSFFARMAAIVAALAILGAACNRGGDDEGDRDNGGNRNQQDQTLLQEVQDRGTLNCGVNDTVPGFGFLTEGGEIDGFDIDFCRAFAAAIFGDAEAHNLVPVTAEERFNALRAGEYDVLVRNTTHTSSRDGGEGLSFAHPNFYDGQGMMVRADAGYSEVADMDGATVCVTAGTTTELNLADYFQALGIENTPLTFEDNTQLQEAFTAGQCDGWTSDMSQLAGIRSTFPEEDGGPDALIILEDVMSKEPLAPAVLDGQIELYDVVNLTVQGLILAEELGVSSENLDQQVNNPDNPQVAGLLGVAFEGGEPIDPGLGVEPTFMQDVIAAVGNYGEIFDRHVGPNTPLGLERGLNALWTDGGIQYAIPFR